MHRFILLAVLFAMNSQAAAESPANVSATATVPTNFEAAYLSDIQCHDAVFTELKTMGASREWSLMGAREIDGSRRLFTPSGIIGVWIEARVFLNKEVELRRITAKFTETRSFDLATCKVKAAAERHRRFFETPAAGDQVFTDQDLRTLLTTHDRGLIYIWSPHMPYSYRPLNNGPSGVENIRAVANKLGLHLTVVVDPAASQNFTNKIVSQNRTLRFSAGVAPQSVMQKAQSLELLFRSMGTHYPVVIVYSKGELARFAYPGVGTEAEYKKFVGKQMTELAQ